MIQGVLIAESLRTETTLDDLKIIVSKITRFRPPVTTPDQASVLTLLHFEADESGQRTWLTCWPAPSPNRVVCGLLFALRDDRRGPGRVFRYARGDEGGCAEASEHGRSLNIPEVQLDWPV
jgi:hypothetical protein